MSTVPAYRPADACEPVRKVTLYTQGGYEFVTFSHLTSSHASFIVLWEWPGANRSTYHREGLHVQLSIPLEQDSY